MTAPGGIRIPITADARGFEADLTRVVIAAMKKVQLQMDARPLNVPVNINFDDRGISAQLKEVQTRLDKSNLGVEVAVDLDATGIVSQARTVHDRIQAEMRPVVQKIRYETEQRKGPATTPSVPTSSAAGTDRIAKAAQSAQGAFSRLTQRISQSSTATQKLTADQQKAAEQLARVNEQITKGAAAQKAAETALAAAKKAAASTGPDPEAQALAQQQAAQKLTEAQNKLTAAKKAQKALDDTASDEKKAAAADKVAAAENRVTAAKLAQKRAAPDPEAEGLARAKAADRVAAAEQRIGDVKRRNLDLSRRAQELSSRVNTPNIGDGGTDRARSGADGAAISFTRLGRAMASVTPSARAIGITTGILAGIVPAASAAAAAVTGLGVAVAAIGPAVGAIAATAITGLHGIKDAFSSAFDASDAGPAEMAAKTQQVAAAQDQVASAAQNAEDAERSLASAQKDAQRAAEDVGRAYRQAGRDLEDAALRARGATISQKEAAIDLREAQKEANETVFDPAAHEEALVRLERAQLNYDKAVDENRRATEDNNDAQQKGIEGSDAVTSAKERQQQAEEQVAAAQRNAAQAAADVAKATQALADAQNQATPSAEKFNDAMAKLSPNAQDFVRSALALKPAVEGVQQSVQDVGFEGLGASLTDMATRVLPAVQAGMTGVAGQFNGAAKDAMAFLGSARGIQGLSDVFAGTTSLIQGLRSGTGEATQGMLDFVHTAAPAMEGLGHSIALIGDGIGKAFSDSAASGQLTEVFAGLNTMLASMGPLLGGLTTGLLSLAQQALPALGPLFESLGAALAQIGPSLGNLAASFANALTPIMPQLAQFISAFADGLAPILPVIGDLLGSLMTALQPLIQPLSQVIQTIGGALAEAITALAPAIGPLGTAFASLVTALAPILPLFAQIISQIVQALAPALTTIFNALGPVIEQLAAQLGPVIAQIAPVLAQVASIIAEALAQAIQQLAPILPVIVQSFMGLVQALLPLLPVFAQLIAQLLPPLVGVMLQLLPIVLKLIDVFTWLVTNVLVPLLIPTIRTVGDVFALALNMVIDILGYFSEVASQIFHNVGEWWHNLGDSFTEVKDWIVDHVFAPIGDAINTVRGWFQSGIDGIRSIWDGLRKAASDPVKFVVDTVWNNGLRKAWNTVAKFLPGVDELEPVTLGFARGGSVFGPGSGTSDSIPAWLSTGEHIVTAAEVARAGGQNILYAIRDMIARGIPFSWDNGRIITDLGRNNLDAYGAAVKSKGIGNVPPEGLFDQLQPRYATGGAVLPWMYQLRAGHDFARAQSGKAYQWAGPRFVGDSFDCSGFMGSIIAAILGGNPWQRYWSTSTFAGYPQVGAQGLVRNLTDGVGMLVGITDDPGGPGGGHTAGELRSIPELGIAAARVESGGALGDVHYGAGTPVGSFASLYGLPIGANGFFQPSTGGGSVGPSPQDQHGFIARKISDVITGVMDPIKHSVESAVGKPPPEWRKLPPGIIDTFETGSIKWMTGLADGLGDLLPEAWSKAKEVGAGVVDAGRKVLDFVNPFDSGGIASGTGFMPKNVISPERVLSPEQTRLFDAMVMSLQSIAGGGPAGAPLPDLLTNATYSAGVDALARLLGVQVEPRQTPQEIAQQDQTRDAINAQGQIAAQTLELVQRTESSQELVTEQQTEQLKAVLGEISNRLTGGVLTPILQSAFDTALGTVRDWLGDGFGLVKDAADGTTTAVNNLGGQIQDTPDGNNPGPGAVSPFGAPGSAFDAVAEISKAVQSVAQSATQAFQQVAQQVADAALAQQDSKVGNSRGTLGKDLSGGLAADLIVKLTGVNIEIRDNLITTSDEIKKMRGDSANAFDATGRIIANTADLMQRNESSRDLVVQEINRINQALIKALLRYLVSNILIPIITAVLSAMITLVVTAIGAAIGSIIPGIGTAIGAAIGAVVGAALAGVAAVLVSGLAIGAGAAIDSFDSGGIAPGIGLMPKNTIEPERVLSPRQTEDFGRLVDILDGRGRRGNTTINAPIHVVGGGNPAAIGDHLLSLL